MTKLSDTQRVILAKAAQHEALLAESPPKLPAAARQAVLRSLMAKGLLEEIAAPREHIALAWRQDEDEVRIALRITAAGLQAIGVEPEAEAAIESDRADETDVEHMSDGPVARETAILPTSAQGDSLTAVLPSSPSTGGEAPERPQQPPVSPRGAIARGIALRSAATAVVAAWDAPERAGLDAAMIGLREALAAQRSTRPPRDPATPRQPRGGTKQEAVLALLRREEGATIAQVIEATGWQPHTVRGFLAGLKRKGVAVDVLERVRQVGPDTQGAKGSYSIYRIAKADSAATAQAASPAEAG